VTRGGVSYSVPGNMDLRRAYAAVLAALCGCASASATQGGGGGGTADAPSNSGNDGSSGTDAFVPQDAPMVSGSCTTPFTGVLATWSFTGAAGNQPSTAVSTTATGMSAGDVARSTGITATSGANSINSSNWATGASPDTTKFYTFGLQPPSGCSMSLTSVAIDAKASSTGPASAAVATSDDSFTQMSSVDPNSATTPSLSVNASTAMVELRVYGYSAGGTSGTFRIQNTLSVSGSLQ